MNSLALPAVPTRTGRLSPGTFFAIAVAFASGLAIVDAFLGSSFAQATGDAVFTDLTAKATDFFYNGRTVILVICACAVIATMSMAITGRFPMQKAITLAFAIVIIAFASSIVTYFASPGTATSGTITSTNLTDTGAAAG
jgi:hypothetical protein